MPPLIPGELLPEPGEIELNAGRPVTTVTVANSGDRPVQVGSHFHFFEANSALKFNRDAARGLRLTDDLARREKVIGLMAANFAVVGEWVCPCKQKAKPPVKGADITCPCPTLDAEVAKDGMCFCRLFVR